MNRDIGVYATLDSFYDYRRGLIQGIITKNFKGTEDQRKAKGDELWDKFFDKDYKQRRMDLYEKPKLGLTKKSFEQAYKERNNGSFVHYYPSNLFRFMLKHIIESEELAEGPRGIRSITLTINTFPYELDAEMNQELKESVFRRFRGKFEVRTINQDPATKTTSFYAAFQHVFVYNLLLGEEHKWLMESLGSHPIPETKFHVPALLIDDKNEITGSPSDVIFAVSMALATAFTVLPINPNVYDYDETL